MDSIFSLEREPYTLVEIAQELGVPYKRVQYCYSMLARRPATCDKVKPLDTGRPHQFSAVAADLIYRNCQHLKRTKKNCS
jgi:hypothetical protein